MQVFVKGDGGYSEIFLQPLPGRKAQDTDVLSSSGYDCRAELRGDILVKLVKLCIDENFPKVPLPNENPQLRHLDTNF